MENRDHLILFFVFSLLLHLLLMLGMAFHPPIPAAKTNAQELEVTFPHYQIADITQPENEERPDKAKFLGLYDSTAKQETVAPSRKPGGGGRVLSGESPPRPQRGPSEDSPLPPAPPKSPDASRLATKEPPSEMPSGLSEDFYPDYKMGDHTYLNVLRFPQVAYFVRLKKVFRTTFNPVPAIRSYATTNQITKGQVEVVLGVSVSPSGNLEELIVLNPSGIDEYDREALRTVRDSSPFTEPPKEFLGADGRLRMSWTFTVYL